MQKCDRHAMAEYGRAWYNFIFQVRNKKEIVFPHEHLRLKTNKTATPTKMNADPFQDRDHPCRDRQNASSCCGHWSGRLLAGASSSSSDSETAMSNLIRLMRFSFPQGSTQQTTDQA